MTLRCQPGDLAVVLDGACVGLFVTVLERGGDHPTRYLPTWVCRVSASCPVTTVVSHNGRPVAHRRATMPAGGQVLFCDVELQPIRPRPAPIATPAPSRELEYTK